MTQGSWWDTSSPGIHVVGTDVSVGLSDAVPPSGTCFVGRMDGAEMADADGVFTQFWEHFRLPDYFGWNWDALSDCLRDLHWIPSDRYLLIVSAAEEVLSGLPEERRVLLGLLARAAEHWALSVRPATGQGVPFNVLLLTSPGRAEALRDELASHRA